MQWVFYVSFSLNDSCSSSATQGGGLRFITQSGPLLQLQLLLQFILMSLIICSYFFKLTTCYLSLMGPLGTGVYGAWKLKTVGSPLRGPKISALNKELCVWLAWFTGNTRLDQCVWPGPATCCVSRRLRQMAGSWDAEWRETVPASLLSKGWWCWRGSPDLFLPSP